MQNWAVVAAEKKGKNEMLKRFIKKHGAIIIVFGLIITIFFFGFFVGRGTKAAPSVENAPIVTNTEITVKQPKSLEVVATAYCPCVKCCGKSDGITATGTKATAGRTIAVDPSIIPYGTEITIDGVTYIAEDCGGAIKGNKVDIFFNTHEEALQFGKRVLTAYIFE